MNPLSTSYLYAANADFIGELYQRYSENPESVDVSWRSFFGDLNEDAKTALRESRGASWAPAQLGRIIANSNAAPAPVSALKSIASSAATDAAMNTLRARILIDAYRSYGHLRCMLDPLGLTPRQEVPQLNPANFGFGIEDHNREIALEGMLGFQKATLNELLHRLETIYSGGFGIEYMHLADEGQRTWLQSAMEANPILMGYQDVASKRKILERLTAAEAFEKFLATKFVGVKRFGLEGGEAMIPAIEFAISKATETGLNEAVFGMAHRGRLNVLTNILGKRFDVMFSEFQGTPANPDSVQGSGDVKYHLGTSNDRDFGGHKVHLTINPNPSHLEWVNPVVTGRVRAKQQRISGNARVNENARRQVLGILIHGDAAFAGQGIVAETLMLAELKGYRTGGTLHFVINNQIGFTTSPQYSRSGIYCSDIAKMVSAPIMHVNGDDVEAVVRATELAAEFRQKFLKDVVIDMVCYRRNGHNEGDEPAFTQPQMYKAIKSHPTTREIYVNKLASENSISKADADKVYGDFIAKLEQDFLAASSYKPSKADFLEGNWKGLEVDDGGHREGNTGVAIEALKQIGEALARVPDGFNVNPKIAKQLEAKRAMVASGEGIDWATGEALAFGSLIQEGHLVRLSGQDCGRGTFSQRHAVLYDQVDEHRYIPLNSINTTQASLEVLDSPLSEAAVMGFDYGFSLVEPNALVCWEGQFGDFANTAQVIIDQFIASSEAKWLRMSGFTLLLPHGYEGQGPEHSSARLERFLQLCAEDNLQVANCSTPANYFHVLRRQLKRSFRKPLILMTPKSLLRHKQCVSKLSDMTAGTGFRPVIGETGEGVTMVEDKRIARVVLCSGKVYYDLLAARAERKLGSVALVRLEQFYPFPDKALAQELSRYPKAEIVWCQEEPENMGAWSFLDRRIEKVLQGIGYKGKWPMAVTRPAAASPAVGNHHRHDHEVEVLLDKALTSS